jgi:hypothetical protein
LGELFAETSRKNREATPRLGVEILIIYMKGYRVSFPLPLIATPELVEFFSPVDELFFLVLGVGSADDLKC